MQTARKSSKRQVLESEKIDSNYSFDLSERQKRSNKVS